MATSNVRLFRTGKHILTFAPNSLFDDIIKRLPPGPPSTHVTSIIQRSVPEEEAVIYVEGTRLPGGDYDIEDRHMRAVGASSGITSSSGGVVAPRRVCVQMWNIETNRKEELHNIMLKTQSWPELEAGVRAAFRNRWTEENRGRFSLYYLQDLLQPLESRADVGDQLQLDDYFRFLEHPPRDRGLMLFLNVAVIFQENGKPVSPLKPPLSIDTDLARALDTRRAHSSSSSHLSPDSAISPQSPGTPREKEFRQMVLCRDSDGCVRPENSFSAPKAIFRCVFCSGAKLPNLVQAAHVIPHSERERLGKVVDDSTLLLIGGVDGIGNGLSVCSECHLEFDAGLMWVEQAKINDVTVPTIHVDDSIRDLQLSIGQLHGQALRLPSDVNFLFPSALIFQWRKEWAVLKRDKSANKVAEKLAKLGLGGDCPGSCGGKPKNKACKNGLCKSCCDKTDAGCAVHPLSSHSIAVAAASSVVGK